MFALPVAEYRDDCCDTRALALVDLIWGTWAVSFDAEFEALCLQDLQGTASNFLWHHYFTEGTQEMSNKYRAFLAACIGGPISGVHSSKSSLPVVMGTSELNESSKLEIKKLQELSKSSVPVAMGTSELSESSKLKIRSCRSS